METRTDSTFVLAADDSPSVMTHTSAGCVSFYLSSIAAQGEGFSIQFLPEHLAIVLELHTQLAALHAAVIKTSV